MIVRIRCGCIGMKVLNKFILIIGMTIPFMVLGGCNYTNEKYSDIGNDYFSETADNVENVRNQADKIMEYISKNDAQAIAGLFCEYTQENDEELINDVQKYIAFIQGNIVSYDISEIATESEKIEYGSVVKQSKYVEINNIKTGKGKNYTIKFETCTVNENHEDGVGIIYLILIDEDVYPYESEYPKEGIISVTYDEIWDAVLD